MPIQAVLSGIVCPNLLRLVEYASVGHIVNHIAAVTARFSLLWVWFCKVSGTKTDCAAAALTTFVTANYV